MYWLEDRVGVYWLEDRVSVYWFHFGKSKVKWLKLLAKEFLKSVL